VIAMSRALDFKSNVGLIHTISRKGYGWVQTLGVSMTYDDVFQEVSLAYVNAINGFDSEKAQFSTYLSNVAFNQLRKSIGVMTGAKHLNDGERQHVKDVREENARLAACGEKLLDAPYHGLKVMNFSDFEITHGDDGEEFNFESSIECSSPSPEQIIEARQEWQRIEAKLSPLALVVVDMIRNPPPELLDEIKKQRAHADYCVESGFSKRTRVPGASVSEVCDFIFAIGGSGRKALDKVEAELMSAAKRL
jgi:hypothetical protein